MLLKLGAELDPKDKRELNLLALHVAAGNSLDVVKLLLDRGCPIELRSVVDGYTALMVACAFKQKEIVIELLNRGANINATSPTKFTALHNATAWVHPDIVQYMLGRGALLLLDDSGNSPLHTLGLCRNGSPAEIGSIVDLLRAIDRKILNSVNEEGESVLHVLLSNENANKNVKTVEVLLAKNVSPRIGDKHGWTPLHCAVEIGAKDVVKVLLEADRSLVGITDVDGNTPLHIAARKADEFSVQLLIEKGGYVKLPNIKMKTPLMLMNSKMATSARRWHKYYKQRDMIDVRAAKPNTTNKFVSTKSPVPYFHAKSSPCTIL
jgi:ankyrin repeat protein